MWHFPYPDPACAVFPRYGDGTHERCGKRKIAYQPRAFTARHSGRHMCVARLFRTDVEFVERADDSRADGLEYGFLARPAAEEERAAVAGTGRREHRALARGQCLAADGVQVEGPALLQIDADGKAGHGENAVPGGVGQADPRRSARGQQCGRAVFQVPAVGARRTAEGHRLRLCAQEFAQ